MSFQLHNVSVSHNKEKKFNLKDKKDSLKFMMMTKNLNYKNLLKYEFVIDIINNIIINQKLLKKFNHFVIQTEITLSILLIILIKNHQLRNLFY